MKKLPVILYRLALIPSYLAWEFIEKSFSNGRRRESTPDAPAMV